MKKLSAILMLFLPVEATAQTGKISDDMSMKSEILNMERKYSVYLPPDYVTSQ